MISGADSVDTVKLSEMYLPEKPGKRWDQQYFDSECELLDTRDDGLKWMSTQRQQRDIRFPRRNACVHSTARCHKTMRSVCTGLPLLALLMAQYSIDGFASLMTYPQFITASVGQVPLAGGARLGLPHWACLLTPFNFEYTPKSVCEICIVAALGFRE